MSRFAQHERFFLKDDIVTSTTWKSDVLLVVKSFRIVENKLMVCCSYYKNPSTQTFRFNYATIRHVAPLVLLALQADEPS